MSSRGVRGRGPGRAGVPERHSRHGGRHAGAERGGVRPGGPRQASRGCGRWTAGTAVRELTRYECGFGYRTSVFNTTARDRYIMLRVTFACHKMARRA